MKTCEEVQELISRLLDGDLNAEEQADVAEHLASCPDCRAMHEALRSLSGAIAEELEEPPARLHETVMADVRREALRRRQAAPRRVRTLLAVAACAALVILGVANLPRMGASAPKYAATGAASEAAMTEAAVMEEAEYADESIGTEKAKNDAGEVFSAAAAAEPAEAAELPTEADAACAEESMPEPLPEPAAAPAPEAAEPQADAASGSFSPWLFALIGLPLIAAAVILLLRGRGRR